MGSSSVHMTDCKTSDVKVAQSLELAKDSLIIADRAYLDFNMLYTWQKNGIHFIVRLKQNVQYKKVKEIPLPDDTPDKILMDEFISLNPYNSGIIYPKKLRRVAIWDDVNKKTIEVLTNQLTWTAERISDLYQARWQIEIFFKEIKSLLKIKSFVGTSENAVLIQIWTALISILILKYLKAKAKYHWCLSNLVGLIRMTLFAKIDLQKWLDNPIEPQEPVPKSVQITLNW